MKVKRLNMSPEDLARFEYTNYSNKKLEATVEYIAMMADVEIPEESDGVHDEQELRKS